MKKIISIILSILCISGLLTACSLETSAQTINLTSTKVKTMSSISDTAYSGNIESLDKVLVTSNISGKIAEVNVKAGQTVNQGDSLFTLDSADILLQVKQAESNYNAAQSNYEKTVGASAKQSETQMKQSLDKAQNELADATKAYDNAFASYENNTDVIPAQVSYDEAKLNYERTLELYNSQAVSQVTLENAKNTMDTAKAKLDSVKTLAKTTLDNAESRLKNAKTAAASAEENLNLTVNVLNPENSKSALAQMENAKAALDIANKKLADSVIKSPISGKVSFDGMTVGESASPQSPAITIINDSNVQIKIDVTETNVDQVYVGMSAEVSVQSQNVITSGNITEISPEIDEKTGTFKVTVSIDNADSKLKTGMLGNVRLINNEDENKIYVPKSSIVTKDDETYVFVVKDGKLNKQVVKVGNEKNKYIEVLDGLTTDDEVIVEGSNSISENKSFNIIKNN